MRDKELVKLDKQNAKLKELLQGKFTVYRNLQGKSQALGRYVQSAGQVLQTQI